MKSRRPRAALRSPEDRLSQIVRTAGELFDRSGYSNASMEQVADAVGLAKPTLYHYVKSKDEILYLIHREFMAVAFAAMTSPSREALGAAAQLRATIVDILALMDTHRPLVRVFFEHFRDLPPRQRQAVVVQRERYAHWVADVIRRGTTTGEFGSVNPTLTALAIFGMCNWAYQWYDPKGKLSAKEIGGVFADIVIDGIGQHPSRPPRAQGHLPTSRVRKTGRQSKAPRSRTQPRRQSLTP